jgi:hypothetical protein
MDNLPFSRMLDPGAGAGEIASTLGKLLNCETWGCELLPTRAEKAAARPDKCHSAAWESCSLTNESIPLPTNKPGSDKRSAELELNCVTLLQAPPLYGRILPAG